MHIVRYTLKYRFVFPIIPGVCYGYAFLDSPGPVVLDDVDQC